MLEYKAKINESVFIRWQGAATDSGLFPQVKIYNIDAPTTVVATLNLSHLSSGLFGIKWKPTTVGKYFTQTIIYSTDYGVDESGIDRPDSDSINVEEHSGSAGFLGATNQNGYKGLTDDEIKKIADSVYELIKPDLINADDIKIDIPPAIDYSEKIESLKNHITASKIKFNFQKEFDNLNSLISKINFDYSMIINSAKKNKEEIISEIESKISAINSSIADLQKMLEEDDEYFEEDAEEDIEEEDPDMLAAKELVANPDKLLGYSKSKKLNERIVKNILWLKNL